MGESLSSVHPNDAYRSKIQWVDARLTSGKDLSQMREVLSRMSPSGDITLFEDPVTGQEAWVDDKYAWLVVQLSDYLTSIRLGPVSLKESDNTVNQRRSLESVIEENVLACVETIGKTYGWYGNILGSGIVDVGMFILVREPPRTEPVKYLINLAQVFPELSMGDNQKKINTAPILASRNKPIRNDIDRLRTDLETESYFGGAVVVSYERVQWAKEATQKVAGSLLVGGSIAWAIDTAGNVGYKIGRILYRDELGKSMEIDRSVLQKFASYTGDKTRLSQLIFRIMAETGKVYNTTREAFTSPRLLAFDRARSHIDVLSPEKLGTKNEGEFRTTQSELVSRLWKVTEKTLDATITALKTFPMKWMHSLLFGVFFREYQKNSSDILSLMRCGAEMGLFYTGAMTGGKMAPGVWKAPASLLAWWVAVVGWELAWWAMWLDKKAWSYFPERETSDGKSVVTHIGTLGAVNDVLDKTDGSDMRVPWTRWWARIYNPLGRDIVAPDISFYRTTVDFGTNPREYMNAGIRWVDHWNARMKEFTDRSPSDILSILQGYRTETGMFSEWNTKRYWLENDNENKKQALRERILPILAWEGASYEEIKSEDGKVSYKLSVSNYANSGVVEDIMEYIVEKVALGGNPNEQKQMLDFIIGNYGNVLQMDDISIKNMKDILANDKKELDHLIGDYVRQIPESKRSFVYHVFDRMIRGEYIISRKQMGRGSSQDAQELKLYQSLLDDATTLDESLYEEFGIQKAQKTQGNDFINFLISHRDTVGIPMLALTGLSATLTKEVLAPKQESDPVATLWDVFCTLLNLTVVYKRQQDFLDEVTRTWYGTKWKL